MKTRTQRHQLLNRDDDALKYGLRCSVIAAVSWALYAQYNWMPYPEIIDFVSVCGDYISEEGDE